MDDDQVWTWDVSDHEMGTLALSTYGTNKICDAARDTMGEFMELLYDVEIECASLVFEPAIETVDGQEWFIEVMRKHLMT